MPLEVWGEDDLRHGWEVARGRGGVDGGDGDQAALRMAMLDEHVWALVIIIGATACGPGSAVPAPPVATAATATVDAADNPPAAPPAAASSDQLASTVESPTDEGEEPDGGDNELAEVEAVMNAPALAAPHDGSPKDGIQAVIRDHLREIRRCYEVQLQREPGLSGKVVVRFAIGADGRVTKSEATTRMHPDVDACLLRVIDGMVFPPPEDGSAEVTYPFVFRAA